MIRRILWVAVAFAVAWALALAIVRTERVSRVDVGGGADEALITGFHGPEHAWRQAGRWTTGDASVRVRQAGLFPTAIRVRFCTHPARSDEQFRLSAGLFDRHTVVVPGGCQEIERPIVRHPGDADIVVHLVSSPVSTPQDARPLGLFVATVSVVSDGAALDLRRARWPLACLSALFVGVLFTGWVGGRLVAPGLQLATVPLAGAAIAIAGAAAALTVVRLAAPTADALARGAAWSLLAALVFAVAGSRWLNRDTTPVDAVAEPERSPRVWIFACGAAAAIAVLLRPAILDGQVLSQSNLLFQIFPWRTYLPEAYAPGNRLLGDIPLVFYPFLTFIRESLLSGSLPLWNPLVYTGQPIFASFQSALLSPFTIVAALTPAPMGTVVGPASRLLTGGLGFFLFARTLRLSAAACWFCGLAFALNAFSLVWLEHPLSAVAAWLPWLLWSIDRLGQDPRARRAALVAVAIGLCILAGHPETAFKVLLFAAAYALVVIATAPRKLPVLSWLAVAGAAGVLLSAVQVLPFQEYLRESRVFADRQTFAVNPYFVSTDTAITTLVPDFWGTPVLDSYVARENALRVPTNYCEQQVFVGAVTWVLAIVGLCAARWDARRAFFVASGLVAAALMYNAPTAMSHVTALPILRITVVSRFGVIVIACVIALAAYGVDALTSSRATAPGAPRRRLFYGALAAAILIACAAGGSFWRFHDDLVRAHLLSATFVGVVFAAATAAVTALLVASRARGFLAAAGFAVAVCVLGAGEAIAFGQHFRAFVPARDVSPRLPEIDAIRADPGLFRVIGFGTTLPPNSAMPYRLPDPRGYDGMSPRRVSELLDVAFTLQGSFHMTQHVADSRILDLLNVKYIVGRPGLELPAPQFVRVEALGTPVFRNTHALPRVLVADSVHVAEGNAARRALRDGLVDPRRTALLEAAPAPDAAPERSTSGVADAAQIRHYRDTFVEVETRTDGRRLLVLTDLWYPGWRARVDGQEAPILRADFAFRAVSVPAGSHVVQFSYEPQSLRTGAAISLAALVLLIGMTVTGAAAGRDPARRPPDAP